MVLLIIIGLTLLKVVVIKLSFICFYFFFSMKSKTRALCLITVSLLTKPPWPSKHKCNFVNGQLAVGSFFVRSQLRSDLASEKFKHLRDFLETSNSLIYRWTLNIGNLDQMHLLMMHDTKRWITWRCKVWKKWDDISE